ncbi:MFS transporter [Actinomadura kijaniata]|uniref:MFS family permease n=1 Tax=Actinomadura namibiensis TaxID=182080 RepID=A0A7W3QMH3_ACTNM|nr:MFS transporter [Actinomadura namibiensis]MBA8952496.1 MFS family permease [Actinomadura namibiensis]
MTAVGAASAATGVPAPGRQRGLMPLLLSGNLLLFSMYGGVVSILLPLQIERLDPANKVANLGLVTGIGAVFATLLNPIGGALSDRSRSRFGRRNPFLLGGAVLALAFLTVMGSASGLAMIIVGWCLAQGMGNVYQAAVTAIVPDRVPRERRGLASAMAGAGMNLGILLGVLVAGRFTRSIDVGYVVLGGLLVAAAVALVALTHDPRPHELAADVAGRRSSPAGDLRSFLSALRHRDFLWVFLGRAMITLGYFSILGYLMYMLKDHIGVPRGMDPANAVAVLTMISTVASVLATLVGGPLSDRLDRRKMFVFVSSMGCAGSLLLPLLSPSWTTMMLFMAVNGLFFGVYMAVDTAMVTLVLPSQGDAARDMGVLNIANAGPQIVSPFVASVIINSLGGYSSLYIVAAVLAVAGALAILPVRSVR